LTTSKIYGVITPHKNIGVNYKMKEELVVKHNALINASYSLNLVEQRLILLAIVVLRENVHNMALDCLLGKPIKITADNYINTYGVSQSTAYETLKDACKTLFSRQFSYQEPREKGRIAHKTTRWVSDIAYIDNSATVEFTFAPAVLPLVTELEKHLTKYEIKQISSLSSGYAIRLYEMLIAWRSTGKTPKIKLEDFRKKIGIEENSYPKMEVFKRRVLEPAIEQINKYTDIKVTYEQHKEGRSIVAFSFKFKVKEVKKPIEHDEGKIDKNTPDLFHNMTESQLDMFSSKLSELSAIQGMANVGEDMKPFIARLRSMLKNPEKQKELMPYLKEVGFKPSK
jgi:plasmid replication initiation protein